MTEFSRSNESVGGDVDPDLYIEDFAEMLRDLIRAVAANDSSGAISNASRRMRNLFAHAEKLPPDLNWYKILDGAIHLLKPAYYDDPTHESDYDDLARLGAKCLAELTTSDGFATARISKSRQALRDEIKSIDAQRKLRRNGMII